ncbi:DegT/DnrJ/EryC1/StrS family aminotransferase [Campylobacter concisus]|uniref:DegT/DnrJ/EryC1/StrS family aminotransferase n=1 Tax=Campylobacter concisus TaxID=199 RepID=UPI000CD80B75|nr:DegT/DnrJ/EryC1/StrS aminotransferase family protein [Campylobacter concisus]
MREIPFYRPTITERESELIEEALHSENTTNIVARFEEKLKEYFGAKFVVTTNNIAAAHHLALSALDTKRGDKVICSINAFPSIAQAVRHFDAEPIFVDVDEEDFNICPDALEKVLKEQNHKKLKCAFISHIAGQSARMDEITAVCEKYGVKILDDANRGMGLTYNGKKVGSDSFLSCFQTHSRVQNPISTVGFFTTNDEEIYKRAKLLRNYALVNGIDKFGSLSYIYDVVDIGLKYDINSINAAFSIAQLERTDKLIQRRQEIAKIYDKEIGECHNITIPVKKREHIYTQYIIKINKNRDGFARELLEHGIHTSLHYIPIHLLSYYKNKYSLKVNDFPNALKNYQQVLSLPIYHSLSDEEVQYICGKVKEISKTRV